MRSPRQPAGGGWEPTATGRALGRESGRAVSSPIPSGRAGPPARGSRSPRQKRELLGAGPTRSPRKPASALEPRGRMHLLQAKCFWTYMRTSPGVALLPGLSPLGTFMTVSLSCTTDVRPWSQQGAHCPARSPGGRRPQAPGRGGLQDTLLTARLKGRPACPRCGGLGPSTALLPSPLPTRKGAPRAGATHSARHEEGTASADAGDSAVRAVTTPHVTSAATFANLRRDIQADAHPFPPEGTRALSQASRSPLTDTPGTSERPTVTEHLTYVTRSCYRVLSRLSHRPPCALTWTQSGHTPTSSCRV